MCGAGEQVQTAVAIVRTEGLLALWSGWQASLARSFFYGGMLRPQLYIVIIIND